MVYWGGMFDERLQKCDYLLIPICRGIKRDEWPKTLQAVREVSNLLEVGCFISTADVRLRSHFIRPYILDVKKRANPHLMRFAGANLPSLRSGMISLIRS